MPAKDGVDLAKSLFELVRNALIVGIILSLFLWPSAINNALAGLGITEFDMWGLKGKTSLVSVSETAVALKHDNETLKKRADEAIANLDLVSTERDQLKARLALAGTPVSASAVSPSPDVVRKLVDDTRTDLANAEAQQAAATRVLQINASAISAAQDAVAQGSVPGWIVLFGSDATEDSARVEVNRAKTQGFPDARILVNRSRYRSGIVFPTAKEAWAALPRIQALSATAASAYPTAMATFCPRATSQGALTICQ